MLVLTTQENGNVNWKLNGANGHTICNGEPEGYDSEANAIRSANDAAERMFEITDLKGKILEEFIRREE